MAEKFDVEDILEKLTTNEKIGLLSGGDYWSTYPIHRLNVPSIRTSDGPNGIRGQHHFNSTPTAAIPVGTALASTWNTELLHQVGEFLDLEARAKGVHVLLAPTVNIQRIPNGGRGFESFSEDPLLSGKLAASYINGFQSKGLAATIKHFVGNDQENERFSSDSVISQRALREIYLKPFEIAIEESNPKALMTSYNKVNGVHVSEDEYLLKTILRGEWNWNGLVMSDWTGTYSTSDALNAGLDLEMPGPGRWRGERVSHSLLSNKILESTLDERALNVLNLVKLVKDSGVPENAPEAERNAPEDREFLRKVAGEGIVLLKNDQNVLPFQKKRTLVIGPNALYAAFSGGGSALATPYYAVSPIQGVKEKIGDENVVFNIGAYNHKFLPSLKHELYHEGVNGTLFKIYNEPPEDTSRVPFDTLVLDDVNYFRMNDYVHPKLKSEKFYAELVSSFIPAFDGVYEFGLAVFGTAKLFIEDELVVDNATNQELGESFYGLGTPEIKGKFKVTSGKHYKLVVQFGSGATSDVAKGANKTFYGGGGLRFGGALVIDPEKEIEKAAANAKLFDQVVIITGLNKDWESEGGDREDLKLPGYSDKLIEAVLDANSNSVVLIQAGTPVELPWVSKASTVVYTSYGGDETGNAIADVLYGDINPSGKLPLSFPTRFEDTPSLINNTTNNGKVLYGEDIYVGYRFYEKVDKAVVFPFGHGLSYTRFELSGLRLNIVEDKLSVSLTIKNVGSYDGAEVVQLYVGSKKLNIQKPVKELKAFTKVELKQNVKSDISFKLNLGKSTAFFDELKNKWVSEKGEYFVYVGTSSSDLKALKADFSIEKTTSWLVPLL
ncbi:glycoside hydrolase family 3 protein [Wickerhamomyces anomalus NRRL Y-366-8]|uniref:beta-glucosidase n=1 Tax=Wickerhamomyces anomalus (strain ATCC 58044 / CBS 1984 / NCYC 433 / NRRL Y-366-8) TaxID=683960 RepID=A0A1E3NZM9_WICAA|nr:glycoside hydrolase family 3 protein [Wickerhamomyces anomalus NRRL Y-366-8]ODQ58555.1 glycoside hydrolase family 3 protein [Wickerhamomyces anomalus NRRL Y-366-8]